MDRILGSTVLCTFSVHIFYVEEIITISLRTPVLIRGLGRLT